MWDCSIFGAALATIIWAGAIVMAGGFVGQAVTYWRIRRTATAATRQMDEFWEDLNQQLATAARPSEQRRAEDGG